MSAKINQIADYIEDINNGINCKKLEDFIIKTINNEINGIIRENDENTFIELLSNQIFAEYISFEYIIIIYKKACEYGWLDIAKILFEREDKDDIIKYDDYVGFRTSSNYNNKEILKLHIKSFYNEEMIKSRYYYVFRNGCFSGWDEIIELLVRKYRGILSKMDINNDSTGSYYFSIKKWFPKIIEKAESANEKSDNFRKIVVLLVDLYGNKLTTEEIITKYSLKNTILNTNFRKKWKLIHTELIEYHLEKIKEKFEKMENKFEETKKMETKLEKKLNFRKNWKLIHIELKRYHLEKWMKCWIKTENKFEETKKMETKLEKKLNYGLSKRYNPFYKKQDMSPIIEKHVEIINKLNNTQIDTVLKDDIIKVIVENMVEKIIQYEGDETIIEILNIDNCAKYISFSYYFEIYNMACRSGNLEIIKKIFEKTNYISIIKNNDFSGFRDSCTNGHIDIVKYHIDLYDDSEMIKTLNFEAFRNVCFCGRNEIAKLLVNKYRNNLQQIDLNIGSYDICEQYSIKYIFDKLIEKAESGGDNLSNDISNDVEIVRLLIDLYGNKIATEEIIDKFGKKNYKKNDKNWIKVHKKLKEKYSEILEDKIKEYNDMKERINNIKKILN